MKKLLVLVLSIIMVLASFTTSFADSIENRLQKYEENYEDQNKRIIELKSNDRSEQLKMLEDLKILQQSENGFELERGLTRTEAAIVYIGLFGEFNEVSSFNHFNPNFSTGFTDVPEWAVPYINYLYNNNMISGVSADRFGAYEPMAAEDFITLLLRGIGYKDSEGEFTVDKAVDKAVEIGMLSEAEKNIIMQDKYFTRDDMSRIVYNTLFIKPKDSIYPLISKTKMNINRNYSELFYEVLGDEEVSELKKAIQNPGYKVFSNDIEKRNELLKKASNLINHSNKFFKRYINGEEIELIIKEVKDIIYDSRIKEYDSKSRDIVVDIDLVAPILGETNMETCFLWKLDGNKLKLDSDINFFGYPSDQIKIEYMKILNKNIIHSAKRLGKNFDAGGVEDFANKKGLRIIDRDEIDRHIYSYDGKKMVDAIIIYRDNSLDYHMFIELIK